MGKAIKGTLAVALFLCTASWAQAALVTFTLQGLIFDDGGTASGSFTLDPELTYNSAIPGSTFDFNLATAGGGSGVTPFDYTPANTVQVNYDFSLGFGTVEINAVDGIILRRIAVVMASSNGLPSGLLDLQPVLMTSSFEVNANTVAGTQVSRFITSGSILAVAAVPEPSTYALMLAGLALVAGIATTRMRTN